QHVHADEAIARLHVNARITLLPRPRFLMIDQCCRETAAARFWCDTAEPTIKATVAIAIVARFERNERRAEPGRPGNQNQSSGRIQAPNELGAIDRFELRHAPTDLDRILDAAFSNLERRPHRVSRAPDPMPRELKMPAISGNTAGSSIVDGT